MANIIKINFTCFFFNLFNVATRKFKIIDVAQVKFLLDSIGLDPRRRPDTEWALRKDTLNE